MIVESIDLLGLILFMFPIFLVLFHSYHLGNSMDDCEKNYYAEKEKRRFDRLWVCLFFNHNNCEHCNYHQKIQNIM